VDDVFLVPSLALPRSLDIAAVTVVAAELARGLALGDLTVDATAVVKVDAAGLQLLCALAITARGDGTRIAWHGVPAVLEDGARTLALTDALGWARPPAQENR
jgi:ABC-type transporter Mla MlaB component